MGAFLDITGQSFGRLEVIEFAKINKHGEATWLCECSCGKQTTVGGHDLRSGHTCSCGCKKTKHGHTVGRKVTPTWNTWHMMVQRCTNPRATQSINYCLAGVKVCRRWRKFSNFLADMGPRPLGTKLGRKGDVGNYTRANCRWEKAIQNRSDNVD